MDESLLLGLYTADVMRQIDVTAIEGVGIPGGHLMERAGLAVADEILQRYEPEEAVVFAGKGNNGGDGFVVARELFNAGVEVTVFTLAPAGEYAGDAKLNLDILDKLGVDVREAFDAEDAPAEDAIMIVEMADVVVDAIFGTGFTGAAKGAAAAAIQLINEAPGAVVSVDIASGVGASTGAIHGPAVFADLTMALHAAKIGHFVTPGGTFSGEVVVSPIGIPPLCDHDTDVWLLTEDGLQPLLVPKGALDHKRSVGTVLVIGGSRGMTGAAHMTAMAAPVMPLEPPITSTVPTERLWSSAPLGTSSGCKPSSVRSQTSVSWSHSGGMPIGETTTSPLNVPPGVTKWPILAACSAIVRSAKTAGPWMAPVLAPTPLAMSTLTTAPGASLMSWMAAAAAPLAAPVNPVPKMASTTTSAISTIMMASSAGAPSASNASRTSTPSLSRMSRLIFASPAYSPATRSSI